jgi:hypothetical protein
MSFKTAFSMPLLFLAIFSSATAATVTLAPSKDNTLIQWTSGRPEPNPHLSNGLGDIFVGRTNQDPSGPPMISLRRGLIQFDIASAIPAGAAITDVSLKLRDVMGLNGDRRTSLHRALQDWGEGTSFQCGGMGAPATDGDATWLYRFYNAANPALSPTWTTPGGDFSSTMSASTVVSDDLGGGQLFTWTGAGMVADVQSWLNNPSTNFGWLIMGTEDVTQTAKRLNSGESTTSPNRPPVLTVTYVPEPANLLLVVGALVSISVFNVRHRRALRNFH